MDFIMLVQLHATMSLLLPLAYVCRFSNCLFLCLFLIADELHAIFDLEYCKSEEVSTYYFDNQHISKRKTW